jgi:hypothetical protein
MEKMTQMTQMKLSAKQLTARIIVLLAILVMVTDTIYMNLNGLYDGGSYEVHRIQFDAQMVLLSA